MEITKNINHARVAADKPAKAIRESKTRNKRAFQGAVFYTSMVIMAVMVIFLQMHWIAKIVFEVMIVTITWFVWGIDTAIEIDQKIPMSPDEKILQDELERRER